MRNKPLLLGVLLLCLSCGDDDSDACAGDHTGEWLGQTIGDSIHLGADCSYDYVGIGGCESEGVYAAPLGASGSVKVEIKASTGGNCLPAGDYSCTYGFNGSTLSFDCGAGLFTYARG